MRVGRMGGSWHRGIWWAVRAGVEQFAVVVGAAGGTMRDIVKLNGRRIDEYRAQLKPLGALFREYFRGYYPTMALFEIVALFQDEAVIEMEGMAVISET
ncbi:MAG: RidA family protein [Thermomicrobiales bacterium]